MAWICGNCGRSGWEADEVGMGRCPCGRELDQVDERRYDRWIKLRARAFAALEAADHLAQDWTRDFAERAAGQELAAKLGRESDRWFAKAARFAPLAEVIPP